MSDEVKVNGLSELQAFLDQLAPKLQKNVMRSALRAGATVIATEARLHAPVLKGELRGSIGVSTRVRGGTVTASARSHDPVAPLVEYGTKRHMIRAKDGALMIGGYGFARFVDHPGARPKPFMRPALDARAQDAVIATGEKIKQRLTKEGIDASDVLLEGDS